MRTIWHQHYFSAILAIAVALALPWHCIVHCAPQMQPSRHSQFVCDMTQTTPTITSNQHQFTSATPLPSAVHVAIWGDESVNVLHLFSHQYALIIPILFGIFPLPALHPPQYQPHLFSF
jgi:hypothetical protein